LKEFIHTHDLNDEAHYAHVDSLLDVPGFMDYFALEMFAGNADWPANNLKYWKPSVTEGKWRYLLYDLDATMAAAGWITNDFDMFHYVLVHRAGLVHPEIFRSLMERMEFRRGFLNRLADLMNTALSTPSLHRENDAIRATLGPEIERHYNRWGFPADQWEEHSGALIPAFIEQRAHFMREDVLQWYDLPNTATLDFTVYPPAAGGLQINTIRPVLPFEGVYFNGNDIDVTAEAAEGWVFDHWTYDTTAVERSEGRHLRRSFASDGILTAHFLPENGAFVVFPDPCTDELNIVPPGGASGPMELLVHDIQGRLVLRRMLTDLTLPPGPLDVSGLVPGTFLITARQNGAARHARFVRMRP
ncbi:MAG TPA: CotH kinase family protein, partial [Flavobacteriales bacterium]